MSGQNTSDGERNYLGEELQGFALATNWRRYVVDLVSPWLGDRVAEIGAGLGTRCADLSPRSASWTAAELDPDFAARLRKERDEGRLPEHVQVHEGFLAELEGPFDTILYLDVLEHIEDDRAEVAAARDRLAPGGRLVVLAPAHDWLFSPFDTAVGHFRRYDRRSLSALTLPGLRLEKLDYVDSMGLFASAVNRFVLKKSSPSNSQIATWDRILVRTSRLTDALTFGRLGKSILAVWTREPGDHGETK